MKPMEFQRLIRSWFRRHSRHDLPWRKTRDPYRILISEIMLQQTQVSRVIPKYHKFLDAFPSIRTLARAPLSKVLKIWQGMGYNRRALYLKRLAGIVMRDHGGRLPSDPSVLRRLPGIGPATAGALAAFAFGRRVAFLETNIRRVYIHFFFSRRRRVRDVEILEKIKAMLPRRGIPEWYYALMDYGSLALGGIENPNRRSAHYSRQPPFVGSSRQARGRILVEVLRRRTLRLDEVRGRIGAKPALAPYAAPPVFRQLVQQLTREGLVAARKGRLSAPR